MAKQKSQKGWKKPKSFYFIGGEVRPWNEVADQFNKRNPDQPPMNSRSARAAMRNALKKIRIAMAKQSISSARALNRRLREGDIH